MEIFTLFLVGCYFLGIIFAIISLFNRTFFNLTQFVTKYFIGFAVGICILLLGILYWASLRCSQDSLASIPLYLFAGYFIILLIFRLVRHGLELPKWKRPALLTQKKFPESNWVLAKQQEMVPITFPKLNQIYQLKIKEYSLHYPTLPISLDGFSILHISDMHFGKGVVNEFHFWAWEQIQASLDFDCIVLSGDFLSHSAGYDVFLSWIAQLHASNGIFAVLGNHDMRMIAYNQHKTEDASPLFSDLPPSVTLLQDDYFSLVRGSEKLLMIGMAYRFIPNVKILKPWESMMENAFTVVINHTPDIFPLLKCKGVDMVLAGHTHGGQIRIPGMGALITPSLWSTHYSNGVFGKKYGQKMVVNTGIGSTSPYRFHCPPEVLRIVLKGNI